MNNSIQQTFNPVELLTRLISTESSGLLEVVHQQTSWQIYLESGQLQYASCSTQSLTQLDYHLRSLGYESATGAIKEIPQSYLVADNPEQSADHQLLNRAVSWLVGENHLAAEQSQRLTQVLVQESLESFLWLTQGTYSWSQQTLNSQPILLEILACLESVQKRLRSWQIVRDVITSPHQRPYLSSVSTISDGGAATATLEKLVKLMKGVSIRHLAAILKQDELKVVQFLAPYIRNGVIYLRDPQAPFDQLPLIPKLEVAPAKVAATKQRRKIVCIDDSPTILDGMKRFLGEENFEIVTIDNPSKSMSALFQFKPDLVLMDITMPGINGYQLCSLLRKSDPHFETIPIVMVTGNRGIIDRAKAKISGATDYLTKPFTREILLEMVNKHIQTQSVAKVATATGQPMYSPT